MTHAFDVMKWDSESEKVGHKSGISEEKQEKHEIKDNTSSVPRVNGIRTQEMGDSGSEIGNRGRRKAEQLTWHCWRGLSKWRNRRGC